MSSVADDVFELVPSSPTVGLELKNIATQGHKTNSLFTSHDQSSCFIILFVQEAAVAWTSHNISYSMLHVVVHACIYTL